MASTQHIQSQLLDVKPEIDNSPSSNNAASVGISTKFQSTGGDLFEASSSSVDISSTSTSPLQSPAEEDLRYKTIEGKPKDRPLKPIYPKSVRNKLNNNIFRKDLCEERKEIFDENYSLSELSISCLANEQTYHIVRPCISLVRKGILTEHDWDYYDIFAEFYIRRMTEEEKAFVCSFNLNSQQKLDNKKEVKIFKILGHLGLNEFLLVQFLPEFEDLNDLFEYHTRGEISWVHRDVIGIHNKTYQQYIRNYQKISPFELKSFAVRPSNGNGNGSATSTKCSSFAKFNGPSLDILHKLRGANYKYETT